LDASLKDLPPALQTAIAILYCAYLTEGHTIYGYKVRYPTLKGYMDAMADHVKKFVGHDVRIQQLPEVPQFMWKTHPLIETIYKDTKEWQGMPNRQDPITHAMVEFLREAGFGKHKHCHDTASAEWTTLGESTGFRGKEWCQTRDPHTHGFILYDKPSSKFHNRIYACCDTDLQFKLKAPPNRIISLQTAAATAYRLLLSVIVRWKFQKNGNHGEKIEFAFSPDITRCPVHASHNIAIRFVELKAPTGTPLAIYQKHKGSTKFSYLLKRGVELKLRTAAWKIYYPECETLSESPAKITLHSIRIGAAMILFAKQWDDTNIMGRLRYKSTRFRMYHRNVPALAALHAKAVTDAAINQYENLQYVSDDEDEDEDEDEE